MDESDELSKSGTASADKRKAMRYLLTGMVQFKWQAINGRWYDGIGITRDVGKGGAFIESDSIPRVGSPLKLTVTLPSESTPNVPLQLGGSGTVCHLRQRHNQPSGFGASAVFRVETPMSARKTEG